MSHFSWYELFPGYSHLVDMLKEAGILGEHQGLTHCISLTLVVLFLFILGLIVKGRYGKGDHTVPTGKAGLTDIMEVSVEKLRNLVRGLIPHGGDHYFPLLGGIFIFVFLNNVLGLFPGAPPATTTIATNLALGLTVFVYYNYRGFITHGFGGYMKHFAGPVWWLAPLMFVIEIIGHSVRPISLSLRLGGNMTGDHMVLGIFTDLTYVIIPVIFYFLGLFVCFVQAFVFTLLSGVYIAMATSHDH